MDRMLYVSMSGAQSVLKRQAVNNNNLANIQTIGFKEDLSAIQSIQRRADTLDIRVPVEAIGTGINTRKGEIINTGRDLDIAIQGDGFLAVQNEDGTEGMTRAGNLRVNASGGLETAAGQAVLGNFGPITVPPYESLIVGQDGSISVVPLGDSTGNSAIIDRIKLVNPDIQDTFKNESGLLEMKPKLTKSTVLHRDPDGFVSHKDVTYNDEIHRPEANDTVSLLSGALESSNVNPSATLVTMIELSRNYEMQIKLMKNVEKNDASIDRLLAI